MARRTRDRPAPTLQDVAALAGVSVATASRALGGYGSSSPEVRTKVAAAAAKLGYRRNSLARSMITGTTHVVGLVVAVPAGATLLEVSAYKDFVAERRKRIAAALNAFLGS